MKSCRRLASVQGEVYKARDLKLGRQEARAASALIHPNIVTIYEIGERDGMPYIAVEYVDGKTLRDVLAGGPLPNDKLIRYAAQMAEGLAKAHQAGIVHRDLKPANTIISDNEVYQDPRLWPRQVDAAELRRRSRDGDDDESDAGGTLLGTVQYMSPEQASGRPVDYRSDQFSFASILYEMMTGRLAFQKGVSNVMNSRPLPPWLRPKADHALRPVYLDRLAVE